MKVKELIKVLGNIDPNLDVGYLHDNGVISADESGVYEGTFTYPCGNKMIFKHDRRKYFVIGNPGNFDSPAYHDECNPLQIFEETL